MTFLHTELNILHKMVIAIIKKRDFHNLTCCFIQFQILSHNLLSKHRFKVKLRPTHCCHTVTVSQQSFRFKTDDV